MIQNTKKIHALEVISNKIHTSDSLQKLVNVWQFMSKKVVFTNGCFDIIHRGHIDYLAKASDLGNEMVVALNSDASVKRLGKGNSRPIQDEQTRAMILASNHFVSAVIIFDEDTPIDLINFLKPDVLVKGADYDVNETNPQGKKYIVGSDVMKANGGEVKTIDFLEGHSTSIIEQKIKNG